MKSISKLKDEARKYEQREEWEKAIQAYLQVLRNADEGETDVELPLYNRVGDLSVRLGKPQEAVRHYEQAADRYAEAGLYNNAIALCNKALRYSPDRLELVRKLGQFSASQGFITDARRYFLDYAERQFKAGKVSEALGALEDFANVADDVEVREMLGRQLNAHGRRNDAVDELRRAYAMRVRDGATEQAAALQAEILAIDPKAIVDADAIAAPADVAAAPDTRDWPGMVELERPETEVFTIESFERPAPQGVEGLERGALAEDTDVEAMELAGLESAEPEFADIDLSGGADIEGLETTTLDFDEVDPAVPTLEDQGLERDEISFGDADGARQAQAFDLPALDDPEPINDLPGPREATARHAVDGEAFDLPLLGEDPPVEADEATPEVPPDLDGPLDPRSAGTPNFDLGGDLPLDLTKLGGTGLSAFDLPPLEPEADHSPEWKGESDTFDLPEIDTDSLDLPTWEPEPGTRFELPTFETDMDVEDPAVDEVVPAPDEPAEVPPAAGPAAVAPREESAPGQPDATPPVAADATPPVAADATPPVAADATPPVAADATPPVAADAAPPVAADATPPVAADATPPVAADTTAPTDMHAAPPAGPDTAASSGVNATPRGAGADSGRAAAMDVPAIELPTWETGPFGDVVDEAAADDDEVRSFDEQDPETAEPSWVDATQSDEEDLPTDLPTFTYEDDDVSAEPTADLDSDWLDDLSDDEPVAEAPADEAAPAADVAAHVDVDDEAMAAEQRAADSSAKQAAAEAARADEAARAAAAVPPSPKDGGYVDLAALISEDDKKESTRFRVHETAPTGDEDRDFAELLSQFKAKVQEHLPAEDAAAHYDLGLAFKEMGLIDEAIGEFQVAMRAGHMRLKVYEELGHCFLQKEQFNIAQKVLSRALDLKYEDELELLGVYYHLGRAYEGLGKRDEARDAYERVLGMDISFGDVSERLARL